MLSRGGASLATSPKLNELLENTLYQAHAARVRVIEDQHLEAAALEASDPQRLQAIRWPAFEGRADRWIRVRGRLCLGIACRRHHARR